MSGRTLNFDFLFWLLLLIRRRQFSWVNFFRFLRIQVCGSLKCVFGWASSQHAYHVSFCVYGQLRTAFLHLFITAFFLCLYYQFFLHWFWLVHVFSVWSLWLVYSLCAAYASATVIFDTYALLCFQNTLRDLFPNWKLGACGMIPAENSTALRFEGKFQFWTPWSFMDQNDKVRNTGETNQPELEVGFHSWNQTSEGF